MPDISGARPEGALGEVSLDGELAASVLGEPFSRGNTVVVPVQEVNLVLKGEGAAKRGVSVARPVALIVFEGEKVRLEGIVRVTPVALAGILLAGWNVYWVTRTIREWRAHK